MDINHSEFDILVPPDLSYLKTLKPPINLYLSEGLALCWLASLAENSIVEIGSYMGKSTCFLAAGSKIGNRQKVYCVDPWDLVDTRFDRRNPEKLKVFARSANREGFDRQTSPYKDLVVPIQGYSAQASMTWDNPIDLIFIDGYHPDTLRDFQHWYPHVTQGGVMAFHDTNFDYVLEQIRGIKKTHLLRGWITINRLAYAIKR